MKKIFFLVLSFILSFSACVVFAFVLPERPEAFVNDYANVLSLENKNSLEQKISNFEKQTTDEIAVVIVPSLDGDTIENLAQEIFDKWGIGKKEKNNGVLLLVAMAEHKTRIQTGYGVEAYLTDLETSYIQSEDLTPKFREGDYYGGINTSVDAMIQALNGKNIVPENYTPPTEGKSNPFYFFIFVFVVFQWLVAILGRSKSWWAGGVLGGIIGGLIWIFGSLSLLFSIIVFVLLIAFGLGFDFWISRAYQKAKVSGSRFPWWIGGGGFGGGSHGGGFGGFGGGFSGGGGSSGSW